jgi:ABC-type uncharacterized transport system permease subunit
MELTFSKADAQLVIGFLASVAVPFITSWMKRASWAPAVSLIIALMLSLGGGLLTEYIAGTLDGGSIIAAGLAVFVASQAHFATWFQSLGAETALNPWKAPAPEALPITVDGDGR